jgi:hypothetical protein
MAKTRILNEMQIEILDPIEEKRWGDFVNGHPLSSIFQHPAYLKALAKTYAHLKPLAFVIIDNNDIKAGLPFFLIRSPLTGSRLVSLPFSSYSDPLVTTQAEFSLLIHEVLRFYAKNRIGYIELKILQGLTFLDSSGLFSPTFDQQTHIIDLRPGPNELFRKFDRTNVRQKINRAEKAGIEIRPIVAEEEMRAFYALLLKSRKRLGLPPQHFIFFLNIWRLLSPYGFIRVLRADLDGSAIGFLLYFKFRKTVYAEYIASNETMFPLGVNQSLFWAAIKDASAEGYDEFDFGKSFVNDIGLVSSKSRWGAQKVDAPTYRYPASTRRQGSKNRRLSYVLLSTMYKKLPISLSQLTSRFLYKHMG